jgi:Xaa-Pro aminopeptidase
VAPGKHRACEREPRARRARRLRILRAMRHPRPPLLPLPLLLTALATAQTALPEPPPALAAAEFRARREALAARIAAAQPDRSAVVLVRGAGKAPDMGAFVQDQDFLYLAGVAEPDVALLLVIAAGGAITRDELLVPPFSRFAATWDGAFLAPGEKTAERTGFRTAGNVRSLPATLAEALAADATGGRPVLWTLTRPAARIGSTPGKSGETAAAITKDPLDGRPSREHTLIAALRKDDVELQVRSLEAQLHPLRWIKSDAEIALLRHCAQIAAEGHVEAMQASAPGMYEFQLAAVARFVFSLRGAGPDAYAAIVGGGPNGCVLHYNRCDRKLTDTDLIVMDYAPTLHGYATDVTRTFPASGKFTPAQRKLVQDVYEIQASLIADVKPGARLSVLDRKCMEMLHARGYRRDHGPCHHVGLAVHDPSTDVLAPGMVITVEPGAYLRDQGMGCRIEDTILVTADGCEVLSKDVPSTPDAIEALMAKPGLLQRPAAPAGAR